MRLIIICGIICSLALDCAAQLSGRYTLGKRYHYSDFKSLQEVADTIREKGISGPVTIAIMPDSKLSGFTLEYVPGSNAINRLTFESATGDSASVVIRGWGSDYVGVVNLVNCCFVTFRNLTIINQSTASFSGNIALSVHQPYDVRIEHCRIESANLNGNVPDEHCAVAIDSWSPAYKPSFAVRYSTIASGTHGIAIAGGGSLVMQNCKIEQQAEYSLYSAAADAMDISGCEMNGAVFAYYSSGGTHIENSVIHGHLQLTGPVVLKEDRIGDGTTEENLLYDGAEISDCSIYNSLSYYDDGGFIKHCFLEYLHLWAGGSHIDLHDNVIHETEIVNQSQIDFRGNIFTGDAFISCNGPGVMANNFFLSDMSFFGNDYSILYNNFNAAVELGFAATNFYNNNLTDDFEFTPDAQHLRDYNNYFPAENTSESHSFHIDPIYVSSIDLHIQNPALHGIDTFLLAIEDDVDGDRRDGHSAIGADAICFSGSFAPIEDMTVTCGDSVYLTHGSCSGATFQWIAVSADDTFHIAEPLVEPYQGDTYVMNVADPCGHSYADTVQVAIIPFQVQASYSPPAYCGIAELLTSSYLPSYNYHWAPANYVSDSAFYLTYAAASDTVVYKVTAENSMCGISEDSLTVPITNAVSASFNVDVYPNAALFHNASTFPAWYVWDFGDGTQSLELNPTHYYSQYTWYYVTLTVTNSCGDSDTISEWVNNNSGIAEEETNARISISGNPNPFSDQLVLIIKNDELSGGTVRLLSMYGQEVHVFTIEPVKEQRFEMPADNLDSGVYVVLLELNDGQRTMMRMVKQ